MSMYSLIYKAMAIGAAKTVEVDYELLPVLSTPEVVLAEGAIQLYAGPIQTKIWIGRWR